jgi:hypothetical protein
MALELLRDDRAADRMIAQGLQSRRATQSTSPYAASN